MAKRKMTKDKHATQKTIDWATRTLPKTRSELRYSRRV